MFDRGELIVELGEMALHWTLSDGAYVLGRDAGADLCLPLPAVSRQQLQLTCNSRGCRVENLSRTNPTFLNGQPVQGVVRLKDEDLLGVGHVRLRYREGVRTKQSYGRLLIRQHGRDDRQEDLHLPNVIVGRDPAADVFLDFPAVSWQHLRLEWQEGTGYRAIDLNSTHGVVVDERRIDRPVALLPNSHIWLGDALGNGVSLIYLPGDA